MHVNAVVSFAAVALQVELAQLLLFVRHDVLVFKLALHSLHKWRTVVSHIGTDHLEAGGQTWWRWVTLMHRPSRKYLQM